jgi:hypothetical protein
MAPKKEDRPERSELDNFEQTSSDKPPFVLTAAEFKLLGIAGVSDTTDGSWPGVTDWVIVSFTSVMLGRLAFSWMVCRCLFEVECGRLNGSVS